ncbi:STT3 domain-containing protein [Chloroflexota bacterium]
MLDKVKLNPKLLCGLLIALFFCIALFIRVYFPYDKVFTADWIKFTGADAYFHMRLVDNIVHNFPNLLSFDPYFVYPGGSGVGVTRFFNYLLAGIIWVAGLGSPSPHTVDVISVYFPAVLGALCVVPVYFIGKELFGRWAGVLSAGLLALLPGEFVGRSILGFTDQHVAEVLLSTVTMLFLILAIKSAGRKQLTFGHLKSRDWAANTRPLVYSLLAGVFLGVYILTWAGALLFVFMLSVYFVIQFIIDHVKGRSTDYLCIAGFILFSVALIVSLMVSQVTLYLVSMAGAILIPLVLSGISRLMVRVNVKPFYYPLALLGLGLTGLGLFYLVSPFFLSSMLSMFSIFAPTGAQLTTIEMQPLLFPNVGPVHR